MQTVLSPNRHVGRLRPIRVIVIHTMESDEGGSVAENIAAFFAKPATKASAHVCVDTDSAVRCVPDKDTAWAAPGANADGLQLEMAGRAGQTSGQWDDAASRAILSQGAAVCRAWAAAYAIPVRWLTDAQLADGKTKGFATHAQVSRVFKQSDHWDPGPNFPAARFLQMVQPAQKEWWQMPIPDAELQRIAKAVWAQPVPRLDNTDAPAGSQLGRANVFAMRAAKGVDIRKLAAAVAAAVNPNIDVDALAKAIVLELGKD